jgi:hypothetical protein
MLVELRLREIDPFLSTSEMRSILIFYYYSATEIGDFLQWQNTMGLYVYVCRNDSNLGILTDEEFLKREKEIKILHDRLYQRLRPSMLN